MIVNATVQLPLSVYWTCQFIARASNVSLKHWEQMGGVKVIEDIAIDQSIHRSINSRSSVLKVRWTSHLLSLSPLKHVSLKWIIRNQSILSFCPNYWGHCMPYSWKIGYLASWFVLFSTVLCNAYREYHLHVSQLYGLSIVGQGSECQILLINLLFCKDLESYAFYGLCHSCFILYFTKYALSVYLQRYVADVGKAWPVLLVCGGFLPLFLSIIWLLMIRHFVAGMPWITVIVFNVLIVAVTMFYYLKG